MSVRPTDLWSDVRYAARALRRTPTFTLFTALVLALGIGASTAVFSAVDAVLLAPLPYPRDQQLVRVYQQNAPTNRWTLSVVDLEAIEQSSRSLSAVGALRSTSVGVSAGRDAERMPVGYVTAGILDALDVRLAAGRRLARADEAPGAAPVTLVGYRFAERAFGSAAAAVGREITVDGVVHRVVGVLRAQDTALGGRDGDVWPVLRRVTPTRRGPNGLYVVGRLRDGMTLRDARRDLAAVSVRLFPQWRASFQDERARLTPYALRDEIVGQATRPLSLFTIAVALVLLIAVANVASLGVVRALRRGREMALRTALGASQARLARLVVTESLLLAGAGGTSGILLGWAALRVLQAVAIGIPRLDTAHLDARSLGVALLVTVVAGTAIALAPAARLATGSARDGMREGSRGIGDSRRTDRIRSAFVGAEFALALPVLAIGALLLVSVARLQAVDPGFDARGVYTMTVGLPRTVDDAAVGTFWTRLAGVLGAQRGVTQVALGTASLPNDQGNSNTNFQVADAPVPLGAAEPNVSWASVNPAFFAALGVPLVDGRMFTPADTGGSAPVALVSRAWTRRYSPERSPVGRQLIPGGCMECPRTTIVGVVGDVKVDGLRLSGEAVFGPLAERWPRQLHVYVRAAPDVSPAAVERAMRNAARSVDGSAGLGPVRALDEQVYASIAAPRHSAFILSAFAAAALLLAAVGIFGLLSYSVALRRREIGVRMALGASSSHVVGTIVGGGMRWATGGAIVGLALTVLAARWVRGALFGVSAVDPVLLIGTAAALLTVALVAAWLPARRAASVDPLEAMRPE